MGRALSLTVPSAGSLWSDASAGAGPAPARRPALPGGTAADVAIVGGGFTGLWTAYYLLAADPTLRVRVLEAEHVGFGASGRNGGWCSALFPTSWERLAALPGSSADAARRQAAAMRASVGEVGRVCEAEGIDADFVRGGTLVVARSAPQERRARLEVAHADTWGDEVEWLGATQARERIRVRDARGATYTPHCARIHPLRLVRGLAEAVERRGGTLHEGTRVRRLRPGAVDTDHGTVRAEIVVRATEGFTSALRGQRRASLPVYSLVTATAPLTAAQWDEVGLDGAETFSDHRHLIVYGQRTADGRLVFGGRGAPYHFGSRVRPSYDEAPRVFAALRETLVDLFPVVRDVPTTHAWGGPLGITRDWCASVGLDRSTGLAWAGGYVGDGVSTTNLAGRTLADLVTGRASDLVDLPWVGHRSPQWEPEPLRWLGVNAGLRVMALADAEERVTRRPSVLARAMAPLLGGH